jgi:hypothetical protein
MAAIGWRSSFLLIGAFTFAVGMPPIWRSSARAAIA